MCLSTLMTFIVFSVIHLCLFQVWSSDSGATHGPPQNIVMKNQKWCSSATLKTSLITNNGEVRQPLFHVIKKSQSTWLCFLSVTVTTKYIIKVWVIILKLLLCIFRALSVVLILINLCLETLDKDFYEQPVWRKIAGKQNLKVKKKKRSCRYSSSRLLCLNLKQNSTQMNIIFYFDYLVTMGFS